MRRIVLSLVSVLVLTVLALALVSNHASADRSSDVSRQNGRGSSDGLWTDIDASSLRRTEAMRDETLPEAYRTIHLSKDALQAVLRQAPREFSDASRNSEIALTLPMPDGTFSRFRIEDSPIMEPELAARFPEIKTYLGRGVDDPKLSTRFDFSPRGFHALILSNDNTVVIQPYHWSDTTNYISYYGKDYKDTSRDAKCLVEDKHKIGRDRSREPGAPSVAVGDVLRTFRVAIPVTQEYTNDPALGGGTVAGALASVNTWLNGVNAIFDRELSVRMNLVANNNLVIFAAEPDGLTNGNDAAMSEESRNILRDTIGPANYDLGQALGTTGNGAAGIAFVRVICSNSTQGGNGPIKGGSATVLTGPVGNPVALFVVSHEFAHLFGGDHNFNVNVGNCAAQRDPTATEPGSGSTLLCYSGNCAGHNVENESELRFHNTNFNQIIAHVTDMGGGGACAMTQARVNNIPTVNGGANFTIPRNTPFTLTATGGDADPGDVPNLTYAWEQNDAGGTMFGSPPYTDAGDPPTTTRPIFRAFPPTAGPSRTFPSLTYILNNANVPPPVINNLQTAENLPNVSRMLNFRCTIRDQRGGVNDASVALTVDGASGPFNVTAPNTADNWNGNSQQTVTWNVANTAAAPVSAANVRISLSTDGGNTFSTVILATTPNDGTELITVPNNGSTTARIKVEAVGNVFFDISDVSFTITAVAGGVNRVADFDGDGKTDPSVFRPSTGTWYLLRTTAGFSGVGFGTNGDRPVPGDYDGDGKTDIAVYRPSNGAWYRLNSSNGTFSAVAFGAAGDIPVPGRFDNDNKTDVSVFRPSNGTWYALRSTDGALQAAAFGANGDTPVSGDYDGDGRTDLAVFRPTTGIWYILQTTAGFTAFQFGTTGDLPLPGDFDGDGKTDVAVYRPGTGAWYVQRSQLGFFGVFFGTAGDQTAAGDYDGDGKTDVGVFRPGTGTFYALQSTNGALLAQPFGANGDINIPGTYAP